MNAANNAPGIRHWLPSPAGGYSLPLANGDVAKMARVGKGPIFLHVAGQAFDLGSRATFDRAERQLAVLGLL